jgi:hypothetical protein
MQTAKPKNADNLGKNRHSGTTTTTTHTVPHTHHTSNTVTCYHCIDSTAPLSLPSPSPPPP